MAPNFSRKVRTVPTMMKYSVFVLLCLLGSAISDDMKCPENCIYKKCADPCPRTCETLNEAPTCGRQKCSPGCQCIEGYVLNGEDCVPIAECESAESECGMNAVYAETPCSTTCADMFTNAPCLPSDSDGCQCLDGYFMNSNGECVPAMECDIAEVICPEDASFSTCASSCPKDCANQFLDVACDRMCNIRCDCNEGYVYNDLQECVLPETCDPSVVECPNPGQVFDSCGTEKTCENMYEPVTTPCAAGCYCEDGQAWDDETQSCIPMGECANSVQNMACMSFDENMQYYSSHPIEVATCRNPDPLTSGETASGCYCKPEYVLNKSRKCVALEDCCVCAEQD